MFMNRIVVFLPTVKLKTALGTFSSIPLRHGYPMEPSFGHV